MSTNVFDPDDHPDLAHLRDRTADRPDIERVYFGEGDFAQGADVNEAFSREANRRKAIGDLIAKDGDRLLGADVIVDVDAGTVKITAGTVYLLGQPRAVAERTLTGVPMTGDVQLGIRITTSIIKAEDDTIFYGLVEGTESFQEEGAIRTKLNLIWARAGDGGSGEFYKYVLLRDGATVSQDAPPTLSGVQRQIASYDYDAHGNYIVKGCEVTALGLQGSDRIFSIAAGVANINGFKVNRNNDNRFLVTEDPEVGTVNAEPHIFADGGTHIVTIQVNRPPIAAISSVIVRKQRTVTLTKGVTGGVDSLPDDSVASIVEVKQGATVYTSPTNYTKVGDAIDWTAGSQPTTGSSYDVTYQYLDAVSVTSSTARTITLNVPTAVTNSELFIGYNYKLPRHDRLCIRDDGSFQYLRGLSSPGNPHPPLEPSDCLSLAVVENDWFVAPRVFNDGTVALTFKVQNRMLDRLADAYNLITIERLKSSAISRSPGAALGIFTDPFNTDEYRDLGETQNAASFDGTLQLPITPTFHDVVLTDFYMLDYTTEIVVNQPSATGCILVAPYINFYPPAADIMLKPARDFWVVTEEVTLKPRKRVSEDTKTFGKNKRRVTKETVLVKTEDKPIKYLREIDVDFTISHLGAGETLAALTFDDVDVNPGSLVANGSGVVTGTFTIPEKVLCGLKTIVATGGSGTKAQTTFKGEGRLEREFTREVTIIEKTRVDPPVVPPFADHGGGDSGGVDPQAQTFVLERGRHVPSLKIKFCAIGNRDNRVVIDLVEVGDEGVPTRRVIGQASIDMHAVVANTWHTAVLNWPVYLPANTQFAFVFRTADAQHAMSIATLGDFDAVNQLWVTSQPYLLGTRFSGSDGVSWVAHPTSDVTMQTMACKFSVLTKTVAIGVFAATNASDIMISANIFLPEAGCEVLFKVELAGGDTHWVLSDQNLELDAFFTGNVTISAILNGTAFASPVLAPEILVTFGTLQTSATYVGLVFTMGNPIKVSTVMSTYLPTGSTLAVSVDANNDTFSAMTLVQSLAIDDGFIENTYEKSAYSAADGGRIKIALTGTPAARPAIADLRAWTN